MFIGNKPIQEYFENLAESDAFSHAYLFYGPEGVGKKSLARSISEKLTGLLSSQDLRAIDKGKDEIQIADIRELKNFLSLTSFGKYKIVIINNAHNLGRDASNALLKVLEEPSGTSILFLITHLPKLLLPTVISRCQMVRFHPIKEKEIVDFLVKEGFSTHSTDTHGGERSQINAGLIAKFANGSLGLALELTENFDNFQKSINLLNKLAQSELGERFEIAKKITSDSEDLKKMTRDWLIYSASLPDKKLSRELLRLNSILSKSQFNQKLALENFLIRL
jgi:DNA polymerase III subunit delta'